jgi:uncharacterized membrane protein YfcA
MNALAGGGSFVTLPALIASGVPSVNANASSTFAIVPGGLVSAWAYRDSLRPIGNTSMPTLLYTTVIGGAAGAFLLLWTPTRMFDVVLPYLLLTATLMLFFGRGLGHWLRGRWQVGTGAILALQFLLGVYSGYFGGAVGLMMIAVWGLIDGGDPKSLNGPRMLLVSLANLTAALLFAAAGAIAWQQTMVMLVAAIAGGYGGAMLGRRLSSGTIRFITLVVATCITLAFFARAYK